MPEAPSKPPTPPLVRTVRELRQTVHSWRSAGQRIALVPTMGALHDGHLSLARAAKARNERLIASVFVNPTQFAPNEDFDRYPRDEAGDAAKLASAGCDLIYAPTTAEMYPEGFATHIKPAGPAEGLETDFRPHFFSGVATIVAKLLIQAAPDEAFFGEKDYQQLLVIKRLARDLDLACTIVGCPTIREPDGLAMSSRNAYLTPEQRKTAAALNQVLREAGQAWRNGARAADAENQAGERLRAAGFSSIDYIALRNAETLRPLQDVTEPARILAAAWLGKTRLIDNLPA